MIIAGFYLARSLSLPELEAVWPRFESLPCFADSPDAARLWLRLFKAISERQTEEMAATATALLTSGAPFPEYLLGAALLGHIGAGTHDAARALWQRELQRDAGPKSFPLAVTAAHISQ
jgi:hypothetical protein